MIKVSLVGTPTQVIAATRTHWQSLGRDTATLDALEDSLAEFGTLAYARMGDIELFGHTNDSPAIVDLYVPDDELSLWQAPLASAATTTVQATRGELTLPAMEGAAIVRPQHPRYVLAGHVLPPESPNGDYPESEVWLQPQGAHDAYATGAIVQHGESRWVNLTPANVWEPGVSGWREVVAVGEIPAWVQPTGAHDAYEASARVTHNGKTWSNTHGNGNLWEPGVFGWGEEQ